MPTHVPYGGYYNRPQRDEDTLLTHVGPGTPCGEYLRRYWHPFLLSSELKDLPVAVRLLGEDLVVFRDKSGRLGLLHRHCAHRGASLEFGIRRSAASAAAITAGTSTSTARSSTRPPSRSRAASSRTSARAPTRSASCTASSSPTWARRSDAGVPGLRQLRLSRGQPARRFKITCRATGCRSSRTPPTRSTTRSCTRS